MFYHRSSAEELTSVPEFEDSVIRASNLFCRLKGFDGEHETLGECLEFLDRSVGAVVKDKELCLTSGVQSKLGSSSLP